MFVAFPEDLAALVADLAKRCGFSITAEAAIINFYATGTIA
jgi:alkylated DNA repair dioxygenase AlkB